VLTGEGQVARVIGTVTGAVYLRIETPDAGGSDRGSSDRGGGIVALLDRDAVRLPIGIVLPGVAGRLAQQLGTGSSVNLGLRGVEFAGGGWPVQRWWNPRVPPLPMPPADGLSGQRNLSAISDPSVDPDPLACPSPAEVADGLAALASGSAEQAVRLLLGAGPGLTPAGDDVLCGALAALAAWAPDSPSRSALADQVTDGIAAGRTTAISAALLEAAVAGCAIPELTRLLTALSGGDREGERRALGKLATIGASSGIAMAAGAVRQLRGLLLTARIGEPA
jgi:hypothetical protein